MSPNKPKKKKNKKIKIKKKKKDNVSMSRTQSFLPISASMTDTWTVRDLGRLEFMRKSVPHPPCHYESLESVPTSALDGKGKFFFFFF